MSGKKVKRRFKAIFTLLPLILTAGILASGCSGDAAKAGEREAVIPLELGRGSLSSLPEADRYNPQPFQVDLRSYDLTAADMAGRLEDLARADFDMLTRWPYILPAGFEPKKIMELGKNPGLGIKTLHDRGITGSGIGVALICSPALTNHKEYADSLVYYNSGGSANVTATAEGCMAASVLCGKTTGVAPGIHLYCFTSGTAANAAGGTEEKTMFLVKALESIMQLNGLEKTGAGEAEKDGTRQNASLKAGLSKSLQIKIVCIASAGLDECFTDAEVGALLEELIKNGVFIVSTSLYDMYGGEMDFNGLGRGLMESPDDFSSYLPGKVWENRFYSFGRYSRAIKTILVPADGRTAASPTGENHYAYYSTSDKAGAVPYMAGLYALAAQVSPDLTPERFWNAAWETGEEVIVTRNSIQYGLKRVANPPEMMEKLKMN